MDQLDDLAGAWNNKPIVVKEWSGVGIVDGDGMMLVVVRQDVDEGERSVNDNAVVDGGDDSLACIGGDESLRLGEDGELEGCQLALMASPVLNRPLGPATAAEDRFRGALEGVKARDKDVGEEKQARPSGVVLVEAAENAGRDEFAEVGASDVDCLVHRQGRVRAEEADAVDKEAVN